MENLDQIIGKADKLLSQHGQDLTDLALYVARLEAIQIILAGFIFLCLALACAYVSYRIAYKDPDWEPAIAFLCVFGLVFFVGMLICWSQLEAWVGVFQPEVYLMSEILEKAR